MRPRETAPRRSDSWPLAAMEAARRQPRDLPDTICPFPAGSAPGVSSRAWRVVPIRPQLVPGRGRVKSAGEIMNILEAYDLTGLLRDAAELAPVPITPSHGMWPGAGRAGGARLARRAGGVIDEFLPKLEEELVERSKRGRSAPVGCTRRSPRWAMRVGADHGGARWRSLKGPGRGDAGGCTGRGPVGMDEYHFGDGPQCGHVLVSPVAGPGPDSG